MNDHMGGMNPPQSNGMAIAALVIGIVSMVLAIIPIIGFLAWLTSPLAIILGALALRKASGRGAAIGGIVTGIIGVLICIAWVAFAGAIMNAMPEGTMTEIQQEMERAAREAEQAGQAGQTSSGGAATTSGSSTGGSGDYSATPTDAGNAAATGTSGGASGDYSATPTDAGNAAAAGTSGGK